VGSIFTVDAIDYREGADPTHVRKLTGLTKFGKRDLKWGVTGLKELYEWHRRMWMGKWIARNIAIVVVDEAGSDQSWLGNRRGMASKYDPMDLNAEGQRFSIEMLEICNEVSNVRSDITRFEGVMSHGFQTEMSQVATRLHGRGGMLHQEAPMRLATAADEILPLKDPRVQSNRHI